MADGVTSAAAVPPNTRTSDAGAQQQNHRDTQMRAEEREEEEDDNDMPLLFMDRLPSDFTSNAQLAAIATFMDDSDTEQQRDDDDDSSGDSDSLARRLSMRQVKKRSAKRARKQTPYAKPANTKSRGDASSAKELQLYLSMFKM